MTWDKLLLMAKTSFVKIDHYTVLWAVQDPSMTPTSFSLVCEYRLSKKMRQSAAQITRG